MHDIRTIRADGAAFDAALARRGMPPASPALLERDAARRAAQTALQEKQARRNALSRQVGEGRRKGEDTTALEAEATALRTEMEGLEADVARLDAEIRAVLESLPNILDPDVPDGPDETANVVLKQWGEPKDLGFAPKQHFELGEALGLMDFATAAKLAGARFTVLRGPLARLERALGQFMLDLHTREHGYEETIVPLLVNATSAYGTGQLPKFEEDLFKTTDGRYLIPTAELPLTNMVAGEIVAEKRLPIRVTALTECFRSEAGAAGRDTRGYLRQHQFRKVELVSITHPTQSDAEHERMTACAERVLELLNLPYRRVVLSSGDTGFGAAKTFDLEVWLPGQQMWREISSCSNTRDFQARRMNARFRGTDDKSVAHVHTLNGSGVAVGRALIAVMENGQQADGSILIPPVLWPYMGGQERIAAA
ncbi:serine--tRNA ligase [Rhodovastum atsumiense]|uniref:Serine--tRNA ligase n=1 Tax=Rhodovastum atsumiense TaxID=504468 RepID=A0A5M6IMU7_9PROT|nr:serine--tRNA ligase [Rhodovastum atsumiense]KAA5609297.1 serine--tRNA ligase [Rhodovastum atsumiense]CAH2604600.1 serine--tRNA ligase [Rhodovastum atsumiense]